MSDAKSMLFDQCGAFFAFSNEQYNKAKKDGIGYVNCGAGLVCDKVHVEKLTKGLKEISEKRIKNDLETLGKYKIIKKELSNHEAYYTGDLENTCNDVAEYGITAKEVAEVFEIERKKDENYP